MKIKNPGIAIQYTLNVARLVQTKSVKVFGDGGRFCDIILQPIGRVGEAQSVTTSLTHKLGVRLQQKRT